MQLVRPTGIGLFLGRGGVPVLVGVSEPAALWVVEHVLSVGGVMRKTANIGSSSNYVV